MKKVLTLLLLLALTGYGLFETSGSSTLTPDTTGAATAEATPAIDQGALAIETRMFLLPSGDRPACPAGQR